MQLMKVVPNGVLDSLDTVDLWFRANMTPVTGFGENIVASIEASIGSKFHRNKSFEVMNGAENRENGKEFKFEEKLRPVIVDPAYAENVQGLSQEALLFLTRGNGHDWGPWEDYDRFVPILAKADKEFGETNPGGEKLKIGVFFAQTDTMIGNDAGLMWFDKRWREEVRGDVEYHSEFVKGADHDGTFNLRWVTAQTAFEEVKKRSVEV
ncbi:hypothetical protein BKA61DRAFT_565498 [Leptodontidium sp. MPI-SDFR-AT-0119]|nr:hypothetical protein BKA61DRAFT_565498 [Leptodontidium sp. MPI-SDFR-AT-0119]